MGVLYSNKHLIDKYHQKIPKTWDELIEIALDIIEKEKNEGNDNIIGYIPHFSGIKINIKNKRNYIII